MGLIGELLNPGAGQRADSREFGVLLGLMFVWLFAAPLIVAGGYSERIVTASFTLLAIQAMRITARSPRAKWVLSGWALLLLVDPVFTLPHGFEVASLILVSVLLIFIPTRLSMFVLEQRVVDHNTIFGALCAYLFMGMSWAVLYAVIHGFRPDAIYIPEGTPADFMTWIYFSFTTLTTLGYGDVAPRLAPVRMLAILEALIGQIYLVVVVARLVSSYMARDSERTS
jgi:hypothetical protein